jgi:hypothetical protein
LFLSDWGARLAGFTQLRFDGAADGTGFADNNGNAARWI